MQTGPAGFSDWLDRSDRRPVSEVNVQWDAGVDTSLDDEIASWSLDRQLTTDQPGGVRLFTGLTSASLKMTMGSGDDPDGDPSKTAAWKYSPVNTSSPLYAKVRLASKVTLVAGLDTADGRMTVPLFTGSLRLNTSKAGSRTAELEALDYWERVRGPVTTGPQYSEGTQFRPALIEPISTQLNSHFVVDEALRQNDIHTAPPTIDADSNHPGTVVQVNAYGTLAPNVGTLFAAQRSLLPYGYTEPDSMDEGGRFHPSFVYGGRGEYAWDLTGTMGLKAEPLQENPNFLKDQGGYGQYALSVPITSAGNEINYIPGSGDQTGDRRILMEVWINEPDNLIGRVTWRLSFEQNSNTDYYDSPEMQLVWRDGINPPNYNSGYFQAWRRAADLGGFGAMWYTPYYALPAVGTGWHHYAVDFKWALSGWYGTVYIDGVAQTEVHGNGSGVAMSTVPDPTQVKRQGQLQSATLQFTNYVGVQGAAVHVVPLDYPTTWVADRMAHTPQATLDTGKAHFSYLPAQLGVVGADLIKSVVAAELGTFEFDEVGWPRFSNRDRFDLSLSPQLTYSSLDAVLDAEISEAIDGVRNVVSAKVKVPVINQAPYVVYKLDSVLQVPPHDTLVIDVNVDKPLVGMHPIYKQSGLDGVQVDANGDPDATVYGNLRIAFSASTAADGNVLVTPDNSIQARPDRLYADVAMLSATHLQITFTNLTGFTYHLNNPNRALNGWGAFNWTDGGPAVYLFCLAVEDMADIPLSVSHQPSIDAYGKQNYDIPDSDWLQNQGDVKALQVAMLSDLHIPRPTIADLGIVPDYRIQAGDLVQVEAESDVGLNDEFWVVGSSLAAQSGQHTHKISLRSAAPRVGWILGRLGRSELGSTTYLV